MVNPRRSMGYTIVRRQRSILPSQNQNENVNFVTHLRQPRLRNSCRGPAHPSRAWSGFRRVLLVAATGGVDLGQERGLDSRTQTSQAALALMLPTGGRPWELGKIRSGSRRQGENRVRWARPTFHRRCYHIKADADRDVFR